MKRVFRSFYLSQKSTQKCIQCTKNQSISGQLLFKKIFFFHKEAEEAEVYMHSSVLFRRQVQFRENV